MAAVATFDICAGFEAVQISTRMNVATPEGSPVVFARQKNERAVRTWQLRFNQDTRPIMLRLKQLAALTFGNVLTMTWTPPGLSAREVRFKNRSMPYVLENGKATSLSVELEEVL